MNEGIYVATLTAAQYADSTPGRRDVQPGEFITLNLDDGPVKCEVRSIKFFMEGVDHFVTLELAPNPTSGGTRPRPRRNPPDPAAQKAMEDEFRAELRETWDKLDTLSAQRGEYVALVVSLEGIVDQIIADFFLISDERLDAFEGLISRNIDLSTKVVALRYILKQLPPEYQEDYGNVPDLLDEARELRNLCAHAASKREDEAVYFTSYTRSGKTKVRRVDEDLMKQHIEDAHKLGFLALSILTGIPGRFRRQPRNVTLGDKAE